MLQETSAKGFTLVECIIAVVIMAVGISTTSTLLVTCYRQEKLSSELASANFYSRSKLEELQNSSRVTGGSLTADLTNYFDNPTPTYLRRWQISADTIGTQTVTVVMIPVGSQSFLADVSLTTRMR